MANTTRTYTGDGSRVLYPIDFELGYIKRGYVYVYSGDDYLTQLSYTWQNANEIELDTPVANGETFTIRRVVPRDKLVNDYADNAILKEKNLDDSYLQPLMILEEIADGYLTLNGSNVIYGDIVIEGGITVNGDSSIQGNLDMLNNQIRNLKKATDPTDAVNLQQVSELLFTTGIDGVVPVVAPKQLGDGVTTTFNTPTSGTPNNNASSFWVHVAGVYYRPQTDFTIDQVTGSITFVVGGVPTAPVVGAEIDITYFNPIAIENPDNALVTATGTTTPRSLADRFADVITPLDFGAIGDGVEDDTSALTATVADGRPIDWLDKTYRITSTLASTAGVVNWSGKGAKILLDSAAPIQYAVYFSNLAQRHSTIKGITIDANELAFIGLKVETQSLGAASFTLQDFRVSNARRSSQAFTGGNGVYIQGDYDVVNILNVIILNTTMAAGAGVSGAQGITGLSIRAGFGGRPRLITVRGLYVDTVASDDLGYFADQDGFLTWTDRNNNAKYQQETTLNISDAFFKNCLGRSIKCQVESADINGIRIIRTYGHTTPNVGVDIDCQVGGGRVSGVSCQYSGWAPAKTIILNCSDELGKPLSAGHVDGVDVGMSASLSMESVVQTGLRGNARATYRVSNVQVTGGTIEQILRVALSDNVIAHASLIGATGDPTNSFVRSTNGPGTGTVTIVDVNGTGGSPSLAYTRSSITNEMSVSVIGGSNLVSDKFYTKSTVGDIQGIKAFTASDAAGTAGVFRPVSFELADGETYKFPQSFRNVNSGMLIVSVGAGRNDQGLFACDSALVVPLASGSGIECGGTTEPTSGDYRLWTGVDGPRITNRNGNTRIFTCMMIG